MFSRFQLARKYFHYYRSAQSGSGHGVHSPFVFQFILAVLNNRQNFRPPADIEAARARLLTNRTLLQIDDLGAGSRIHATKTRSVAQLARSAVKPKRMAHLLYRLVKKYSPATILELGTSLGVTTAYFAAAAPAAKIVTIEGSGAIRDQALSLFKDLKLEQIDSLLGNFDDVLPVVLKDHPSFDLVYIDGNHRYAPTINYFTSLLPYAHNNTILVFDDIHWSTEMEQAWREIQQHPSVRCTIDIFFLGFVFFRSEFKVEQHFTIRH